MQKKLIALAVAALASSSAFAQVTVAGIADVGFVNSKTTVGGATTNKKTGIDSGHLSGSRLIVKADEDLGNGLSAGAYYEVAVDLTDSSTNFFGISRQSFVNLKSASAGEVRLGRQYSAASATSTMFDPFGGSPTLSIQQDIAADTGSDLAAGGVRHNSTLGYIAPKFGGVQIAASYSFGEENTAPNRFNAVTETVTAVAKVTAAKTLSLSGTYAAGPVAVGLMYTGRSDVGGTAAGAEARDITDLGVGASYDLGVAKLFAMYQNSQDEQGAVESETDQVSIGALIPVGSGNIHLGYSTAQMEDREPGFVTEESKFSGFSLGYTHALSKRTTAYAGYTTRKAEDDTAPVDPISPIKVTSFAVGMRHAF